MTPRLIASAAVAVLLLSGDVQAQDPLKSGPPVGAKNNRRGFFPQHITGPTAGKHLCPV